MKYLLAAAAAALLLLTGCGRQMESGIDKANFDATVRPQDDFYRYVNGSWLDRTEIPADKSNYGSFTVLYDESQKNLRAIIEEAAASDSPRGSEAQKIGDLFRSFMDTVTIERRGVDPIRPHLERIAAVDTRADLLAVWATLQELSVSRPFSFWINQDLKQSDRYISYVSQSGLGLPDRSYYFNEADKFATIREKYVAYIQELLTLAGQDDPAGKARRIMALETELATHHWERAKNRDRDLTYNKYSVAELTELMPAFDWAVFLDEAGAGHVDAIVVRQPDYFQALDRIVAETPMDDWKAYFTFRTIHDAAPLLSSDFDAARFRFSGTVLQGIEQQQPRWKRGVNAINSTLGEMVGRLYVEKHFKPEAKARMNDLVANVKDSFRERILQLDWMSEDTKQEALKKLAGFTTKIGYPDEWKDYSALEIEPDALVENFERASRIEYRRELAKLGQPIDRGEWFMNPQTVNAYYNPAMNEIVFPAAILQPPFFNMSADDAVNYGAIGAVIGHELTHGFDDQGRKSDGEGNLRDWWSESDAAEFTQRAEVMVAQYNGYTPLGDTMRVNGRLTLGENIADLGGLTIAYYAYNKSLNGEAAPVIDGLTGEQRFFMGWAQVWRRKYRDDELRRRILTDSHSPSRYRVEGVLSNMPEFYAAFDVQPGDAMYRPDDQMVKIW